MCSRTELRISKFTRASPILTEFRGKDKTRIRMRNGADMRIKRGADMRIKRGADMRIKRGADMRIKRGWVVFFVRIKHNFFRKHVMVLDKTEFAAICFS